jgi:adenine/guanine phosphoribosyltransferase-like PRPP-binding protein
MSELKQARQRVASQYELPLLEHVKKEKTPVKSVKSVKATEGNEKKAETQVHGNGEDDFVLVDLLEGEDKEYVFV